MSMYFLDETDDWPEYQIVRDEIHRLELARVEVDKKLQEAEVALRQDSANQNLIDKIDRLRQELKAIEKKLDESLSMYR